MARGRGRRTSETGSSAAPIENASPVDLEGLLDPLPALPIDPVSPLDVFEGPVIPSDQRAFSFDNSMEVFRGGEVNAGRTILGPAMSNTVAAQDISRAAICVRRSERREVLFAKGLFRKGGGGSNRKRTWRSGIKC